MLEHNNDAIKNLLRNICSTPGKQKNSVSPQDAAFLGFIKMLDTVAAAAVRDRVYKLVFPLIYVWLNFYLSHNNFITPSHRKEGLQLPDLKEKASKNQVKRRRLRTHWLLSYRKWTKRMEDTH